MPLHRRQAAWAQTAARYAHLANPALRDAANKFATGLKMPQWKM